jgi:hypothetical protein
MNILTVEVHKHIKRPLNVVSRQFGDMHHHATDRVHPDIKFTVLQEQGIAAASCGSDAVRHGPEGYSEQHREPDGSLAVRR